MQRRIAPLPVLALAAMFSVFIFPGSVFAQGGPPSSDSMASAAQEQQRKFLKSHYGFSDAQVDRYRKKEKAIYDAWQTQLTALRKKSTRTKDPVERRRIFTQMRDLAPSRDAQLTAALRSVATPAQQKKM